MSIYEQFLIIYVSVLILYRNWVISPLRGDAVGRGVFGLPSHNLKVYIRTFQVNE